MADTPVAQPAVKPCRCGSSASPAGGGTQWRVSCDARPTCGRTASRAVFHHRSEEAKNAAIEDWNARRILWVDEWESRRARAIAAGGEIG